MKRLVLFGLSLILLIGCATVDRMQAKNEMQDSKAQYKACLRANPDNPDACAAQKAAYEADIKAYREIKKGFGGNSVTVDSD